MQEETMANSKVLTCPNNGGRALIESIIGQKFKRKRLRGNNNRGSEWDAKPLQGVCCAKTSNHTPPCRNNNNSSFY